MNAVARLQSANRGKHLARYPLQRRTITGVRHLYERLADHGDDYAVEEMIKMVLALAEKHPRELGYLANRLLYGTPQPSERNGYRYTIQYVCGIIDTAIRVELSNILRDEVYTRLYHEEQKRQQTKKKQETPEYRETLAHALTVVSPEMETLAQPLAPPPLPELPPSGLDPHPEHALPGCLFKERFPIRVHRPYIFRYPPAAIYLLKRKTKYKCRVLWAASKAKTKEIGRGALNVGTVCIRNFYPYGPNAPTYIPKVQRVPQCDVPKPVPKSPVGNVDRRRPARAHDYVAPHTLQRVA